jgi:pyrroline-5-carboxylate reductase
MMRQLSLDRVAVIGAGKMGITMIQALLERTNLEPGNIVATRKHAAPLEELARDTGVQVTTDNREAARGADVILLCVKPQTITQVIDEIGPDLTEKQMVVSIAAGVTSAQMDERLSGEIPMIRAMPNTPSLIGAGMTAVCGGEHATEDHLETARQIFAVMGRCLILDEKYFDAFTGLGASGPAFVYIIIESLAEGGVKMGLPRQVATEVAAQACLGASQMVLETEAHPALLKDAVTTPAGCTMDGIITLEEGGLRVTLIKTVVEATRRAGQLG